MKTIQPILIEPYVDNDNNVCCVLRNVNGQLLDVGKLQEVLQHVVKTCKEATRVDSKQNN